MPERPKGADCKSAGYAFGGSNPPPSTPAMTELSSREPRETTRTQDGGPSARGNIDRSDSSDRDDRIAGVAQLVELQPSKLVVEGSSPFARSNEDTEITAPPTSSP